MYNFFVKTIQKRFINNGDKYKKMAKIASLTKRYWWDGDDWIEISETRYRNMGEMIELNQVKGIWILNEDWKEEDRISDIKFVAMNKRLVRMGQIGKSNVWILEEIGEKK